MWDKRKVKDEHGHEVDATVVGVAESTEKFSEIVLDDGTKLRAKLVVLEACRLDNRWDPNSDEPVYLVKSQNVVSVVSSPAKLKRPGS